MKRMGLLFFLYCLMGFGLNCGDSEDNGNGGVTDAGTSDSSGHNGQPDLPEGALLIVTLGDSLTQGDGDDNWDGDESTLHGWPARILPMIQGVRPGSLLLNLGQSGNTSDDLIASQLSAAMDESPDIVTVWIGSNDLWYSNNDSESSALSHYRNNIDTILRELTTAGIAVYIALLDDQSQRPCASDPEFDPGTGPLDAEDRARMSQRVSLYNEAIVNLATLYDATTVDFFNTDIFTTAATLAGDGNHPNALGYDELAEIWFAAVQESL